MYEFGRYLISERPINFYSDAREGKIWLTKAAEKGHVGAMEELGSIYELDVTPMGQEKTWYWYTKAAEAGSLNSMNRLGQAYRFGDLGVPKDESKAIYWYEKSHKAEEEETWGPVRRSALAGNAVAMENLGQKYENASAFDGSKQAFEWYIKAAQAGNQAAMVRLANVYEQGELGLPKDQGKAVEWHTKAAQAGNKDAMMRLVNAYQHGELGIPKDQGKSDFWFRKWQEAMGAK
jgi:hypothetical protein